jgi:hypothetical protein
MSLDTIFSAMEGAAAPVEGTWNAVQFSPNPSADERFNIGVVFTTVKGQRFFRVLQNSSSFRCLYGKEAQDTFQFVLNLVQSSLEDDLDQYALPSSQVTLGQASFAAGSSGQEIADRLFREVVTLSRDHTELDQGDDVSPAVSNTRLRKRVFQEMHRISATTAKKLIADRRFVVKVANAQHELDIPLRGPKRFGSLVSAHYLTANTRKISLTTAVLDLSTARQFVDEDDKGALFILRAPTDGRRFTEHVQRQIDNDIDDMDWRLSKIKVKVNTADSEGALAQEIISWGRR